MGSKLPKSIKNLGDLSADGDLSWGVTSTARRNKLPTVQIVHVSGDPSVRYKIDLEGGGALLGEGATVPASDAIPPELLEAATEFFGGNEQLARSWIARPAPALHGEPPQTRAQTDEGLRQTLDLLVRLSYGIPS